MLTVLRESRRFKDYSNGVKTQAVEHYVNASSGLELTCDAFNISSSSILREWIKLYTNGKELKSIGKGSRKVNTGRKNTWKERIEIAQVTSANELDYHKSEEYEASYQQVYQWVRKYQKGEPEELKDRRGDSLASKEELTSEEKFQL